MLIEGVTKDKNANVRADCALGLGHIGTQSFRILLIALNDDS
jgi:HEAT repeat protein